MWKRNSLHCNHKTKLNLSFIQAKIILTFNRHGLTLYPKNAGCLQVENVPVKGRDLEAMKNVKSNSKANTAEPAKGMKMENCKIPFYIRNSPHLYEVVYSESDKPVWY